MKIRGEKVKILIPTTIAALFLSAFLMPQTARADLTIPQSACGATQASHHLASDMPQEDGTKAFKYGSDNNHFASRTDNVITFNVNLLFASSATTTIKLYFMDASCNVTAGYAFQQAFAQNNTFVYDWWNDTLAVDGGAASRLVLNGVTRYLWIEVLDQYPAPSVMSYSYVVDVNNIANPTGSLAPTEPSGKRPVLIIPGIMGSELYDGNNFIWPNIDKIIVSPKDRFVLDSLSMDEEGKSRRMISLGNVVKKINYPVVNKTLLDTFESLTSYLDSNGYTKDQNYFFFPYDWRLDLNATTTALKNKIDDIKTQTGFFKVDIIAHSMGGLLVEDYLKQFGKDNINKLIFVGTPHLGAPKAAQALLTGDIDIPAHLLSWGTMKQLALNMPSTYQLLPNARYLDKAHWYLQISSKLDYEGSKTFLKSQNLNSKLIDNAGDFWDQGLDSLDYSGVDAYNISGCSSGTQAGYIFDSSGKNISQVQYVMGDQTVPLVSADYLPIDSSHKYYVTVGGHGELPSLSSVRSLIVDILNSSIQNSYGNLSTAKSGCVVKGYSFTLHSPVLINIYDEAGNHAGPIADGGFENNIQGLTYDILNNEKFIFVPDDGRKFDIQASPEDNGTFDLFISKIIGDDVVSTQVYNDVAITDSSKIDFRKTDSGFSVRVDSQVLTPDSTLSGGVTDTAAPATQIQLTGDQINDNFLDSATIKLTASDDSSGVLQTKYSINDNNFQLYHDPVPINLLGNFEFKYYSIDNAGNDETAQVKQFSIITRPISGGSYYAPLPPTPGKVLGETKTNPAVEKEIKDGTLVLDAADLRTVYMIGTGGRKYGFTSQEVFWGMDFNFDNLVIQDLSAYDLGGLIETADQPHPDGTYILDGSNVWFINYGTRQPVPPEASYINIVRMNSFDEKLEIKKN